MRVLKLATRTDRVSASTGMPACARSPPKTMAVPKLGLRSAVGAVSGDAPSASKESRGDQKPVPPPEKSRVGPAYPNPL